MKIRQGVKFHDREPLDAAAILCVPTSPACELRHRVVENRVRTRLPGGGKQIRTAGPTSTESFFGIRGGTASSNRRKTRPQEISQVRQEDSENRALRTLELVGLRPEPEAKMPPISLPGAKVDSRGIN